MIESIKLWISICININQHKNIFSVTKIYFEEMCQIDFLIIPESGLYIRKGCVLFWNFILNY